MPGETSGHRLGGESPGLCISLDGRMRADAAIRIILCTLRQAMLDNLDGTRRDLDPKFLHDFRVAVRRTRSCLSQIKNVLPVEEVEPFRRELSWLGEITGPTRDLDVHLQKLRDDIDELPKPARIELSPLIEYLQRQQREEQERLAALLSSDRYEQFVSRWGRFLERPDPIETEPRDAARPIAEIASERIARSFSQVVRRGRGIGSRTKSSKLHRLRIECKKLRYLLEFFRSLHDPEELGPPLRLLKRLQDCLGDFNDLEVQQESLQRFAHRMGQEGFVPAGLFLAAGRLVERLASRQEGQRRRFAQRFAEFDCRATHERLERMTRREIE